ncbi:MAG: hypothetical protein ACK58B_11945 [Dolichospermum sp.]
MKIIKSDKNHTYIGIRFDSVNLLVWSGNREQGTGNREHRKKDRTDTY